jgi:ferredoxin
MWGSCGSGAACSLCDQPIRPEEVEYEVATPDRAAESGERVLRFHLECHAIWEAECGKEHS